jgi:hypothetical protein
LGQQFLEQILCSPTNGAPKPHSPLSRFLANDRLPPRSLEKLAMATEAIPARYHRIDRENTVGENES